MQRLWVAASFARGRRTLIRMAPVVLSLQGVSKRFGTVQALRDVSLECRAGEMTFVEQAQQRQPVRNLADRLTISTHDEDIPYPCRTHARDQVDHVSTIANQSSRDVRRHIVASR